MLLLVGVCVFVSWWGCFRIGVFSLGVAVCVLGLCLCLLIGYVVWVFSVLYVGLKRLTWVWVLGFLFAFTLCFVCCCDLLCWLLIGLVACG